MRNTAPAVVWTRIVAAVACLVLVSGCGLRSASGAVLAADPGTIQHYESLEGVPITVAAKDFTEQLILGNMLSTILSTAGADVTNLTNTPGSFGVRQAMLNGDADISPEYTGTGWINYLGNEEPIKDEIAQWQAVDEADQANGLTWLPPAPMNNTYAFAIREDAAERLGVTKLSDLTNLDRSELTFCVESEFASRNDGFVPMLRTYGLTRDDLGGVTTLDTGVIYTATADGVCNFGEVFTTDGRIPALNLRVLEDDKTFFPLYNLTEVVDSDLLAAHPELIEIFGKLNPKLTNETMLELNAKVDNDGDDPALVARDWLLEQGLVT
ncbi:glycine betaine ABC transporter substrate-binding protein [Mycolicibacterium hippocampi]|uniref:Glycine/betaine ABC transporter substrate-binding protein n=1 Tax=Mycolicibacterium hippocampi TaxID=659824 RepID=A0A7I9ZG17_9MYCO|nr:glycine betaine ABC transporter substrate-binding protein [Mycolicibacterium hippocampi]GFG99959.1 glycine/betaine ABC transporter substrate-binding protein [Mycolicibacterium hippocampi]